MPQDKRWLLSSVLKDVVYLIITSSALLTEWANNGIIISLLAS